ISIACRIFMYMKYRFFFSSRRRHTRSKRDWSSGVCSSDLGAGPALDGFSSGAPGTVAVDTGAGVHLISAEGTRRQVESRRALGRSEERRVGKERSGGRASKNSEDKRVISAIKENKRSTGNR